MLFISSPRRSSPLTEAGLFRDHLLPIGRKRRIRLPVSTRAVHQSAARTAAAVRAPRRPEGEAVNNPLAARVTSRPPTAPPRTGPARF
jgi:hypothetical protein